MKRSRSECIDRGVGSRARRYNTCAGPVRVGCSGPICKFHAIMRAMSEALRSLEEERAKKDGSP